MIIPCALTIAGSDPSGGAGLQADLKVFQQFQVYGATVVTLITVQNTQTVSRVSLLEPLLIAEQFTAVISDIPITAIKTGALGSSEIVKTVASCLSSTKCPIVIDPVMVSTHGEVLLENNAQATIVNLLLPHATLLTPNIAEAELLSGVKIDSAESAENAARKIISLGARNVLIKGGHLSGHSSVDILVGEAGVETFSGERSETNNTHGSGCTLSAAITARLACGEDLISSIAAAKRYVTEAIATAPKLTSGYGPLNHFAKLS